MELHEAMNWIADSIQSPAFNNLSTGAFGAFFGAWGAQAIISRGQRRQSVVAELNNISAALGLCFSICNTYASLKAQHVRPLSKSVEDAREQRRLIDEKNKNLRGPLRRPLELTFDFRTIPRPRAPIELLEKLVFEKIAMRGRGPIAFIALMNAVDSLNSAIAFREELILDIKARNLPAKELVSLYLGSPVSDRGTDSRYPDSVEAIDSHTNDCIFFSQIVAADLAEYGKAFRKKHSGPLTRALPKLPAADWSSLREQQLLPDESNYASWLSSFEGQPITRKTFRSLMGLLGRFKARLKTFQSGHL
ncbi:hypothetical protein QA646_10015 [Rhizobium sp. CB3090]|uniref:hypothetical protein n=1 Tax=Rhizobium sp. CB3090 TaxID=3039156 RepID=UPI0024B100E9|nr:hypothetical protein [Rhizobium sp. CB3090]WFU07666.1 hypothetical protein QA646_10015 [Rhizobium sp. CB3090]